MTYTNDAASQTIAAYEAGASAQQRAVGDLSRSLDDVRRRIVKANEARTACRQARDKQLEAADDLKRLARTVSASARIPRADAIADQVSRPACDDLDEAVAACDTAIAELEQRAMLLSGKLSSAKSSLAGMQAKIDGLREQVARG